MTPTIHTPPSQPSSSAFGKRLAHTDKKVRDKAVKSLVRWLSSTKELSHLEWMKLWKGLFYCFWMSDKPLIQQQLAEDLASLAGRLERKAGWAYVNAFWDTMTREWTGIDRLRLDKFYMLFRKFIYQSFKMLAAANWNESEVATYTDMLSVFPLSPTNSAVPDSIRYHVTDIYLEELEKAVPIESFSSVPMTKILAPFTILISQTSSATVFKRVKEGIFDSIFERAKRNEDMYDVPAIAVELHTVSTDALTTQVNRNRMLKLHEVLSSHCPTAVRMMSEKEESKSEAASDVVEEDDQSDDGINEKKEEVVAMETEPATSEEVETVQDAETKASEDAVQGDDAENSDWEDISADDVPCFDDWEPASAKEMKDIEMTEEPPTESKTEPVFQVPSVPSTKVGKKRKTKAKKASVSKTEEEVVAVTTTPLQTKPAESVPPSSESKRVVWRLANNTVKCFRTKSPSLSVSSSTPAAGSPINSVPSSSAPKSVLKIRSSTETDTAEQVVVPEQSAQDLPSTTEKCKNKRKRASEVAVNMTLTPDMSPAELRKLTEYNTTKNQPPPRPKRLRGGPTKRGGKNGRRNGA